MAQATCSQIPSNPILVLPVYEDKLTKYGVARVKIYCLCTAIPIRGLYMLRFHLR